VDRRTVVLGLTAAVVVAAAVGVAIIGRSSSPKHDAVARYITDVDTVQQQMQAQLTKTVAAFRTYAKGGSSTPELAQAELTLRLLQRRLVALPAPPPAKHLRILLLRLTALEVAIAHEVAQLSAFTPRYAALLRRSRAASVALSHALAAVKPPVAHQIRGTRKQVQAAQAAFTAAASAAAAEQAVAVDAYDAKVAGVELRLRALDAPPVMASAYRAQLQTLGASRTAGGALAAQLRKQDRSQVAVFGRRFTLAARTAGSLSAQKAQIAAIAAYNRRVRRIGTLQGNIRQELLRLQSLSG
jgi:hypothetical protein